VGGGPGQKKKFFLGDAGQHSPNYDPRGRGIFDFQKAIDLPLNKTGPPAGRGFGGGRTGLNLFQATTRAKKKKTPSKFVGRGGGTRGGGKGAKKPRQFLGFGSPKQIPSHLFFFNSFFPFIPRVWVVLKKKRRKADWGPPHRGPGAWGAGGGLRCVARSVFHGKNFARRLGGGDGGGEGGRGAPRRETRPRAVFFLGGHKAR